MMAEYRVRIGEFRIYVKVLNLHIKAVVKGTERGKGTFSTIFEKSIAMQKFVTKVQWKNIHREAIEEVVREVAISKLCSVLGIGPAVETSIPFDVIVYTDAVQFHLENCEPLSKEIF
jgi:Mn-dependent DtxR family transcriptional regulator